MCNQVSDRLIFSINKTVKGSKLAYQAYETLLKIFAQSIKHVKTFCFDYSKVLFVVTEGLEIKYSTSCHSVLT